MNDGNATVNLNKDDFVRDLVVFFVRISAAVTAANAPPPPPNEAGTGGNFRWPRSSGREHRQRHSKKEANDRLVPGARLLAWKQQQQAAGERICVPTSRTTDYPGSAGVYISAALPGRVAPPMKP